MCRCACFENPPLEKIASVCNFWFPCTTTNKRVPSKKETPPYGCGSKMRTQNGTDTWNQSLKPAAPWVFDPFPICDVTFPLRRVQPRKKITGTAADIARQRRALLEPSAEILGSGANYLENVLDALCVDFTRPSPCRFLDWGSYFLYSLNILQGWIHKKRIQVVSWIAGSFEGHC